MKAIFILIIGIGLPFSNSLYSQELELAHGDLESQLVKLMDVTGWYFNYDPEILKNIHLPYPREINIKNPSKAIQQLLKGTKIDFEVVEGVFVLLPPRKKEYRICGFLKDEMTGAPLAYAHVYLDEIHSSWSNDEGYFEIEKAAYKNEKIYISYLGYRDTILYVDGFSRDCNAIRLQTDEIVFSEEIIIRDYLFSAISQGKSFNGIDFDIKALNYEMGALEKDVLKSIQFLPGVTSLDESASNISIRGSQADHNLILWEDVPMYNSGHFFGMISSVNPFVIKNLSLNNDVYSAAIDNRIGGVVEINLPDEIPKDVHLGIGSTLTELHSELITPVIKDKIGLVLSGRISLNYLVEESPTFQRYGEKIFESSEIVIDDDENMSESELELDFYDVNSKILYQATDQLSFSSAFFTTKDNFLHEYEFQSGLIGGYDSLDIRNRIFSNSVSYAWSTKSESTIRFNSSKFVSEYVFLSADAVNLGREFYRLNKNEISDVQLKLLHTEQFENLYLKAGYIYDKKKLEFEIAELAKYEADNYFEEEKEGEFHHLFADVNWKYKDFLIDFGTRLSYLPNQSNLGISPRFTLSYIMKEECTLRLSSGLFNQYISQVVNLTQSQLNLENRVWTLIPEEPMTARKLSIGVVYNKDNWLLDLDAYLHHSSSVPVLSSGQSSSLNIDGGGSSISRGIEFLLKKRWLNFSSGISYHFGFVDYDIPSLNAESFPANIDQRHNLSLITHYKRNGWNFSLQYALKSGLPYSDLDGIQLVQNMDEEYYEVELKGINDQRLPIFSRLDMTIAYRATLFEHFKMDFQVSLFNMLDTKNSLSRSYLLSNTEQSTDEPEIFEVEKFQLRRTPQLLIRFSF